MRTTQYHLEFIGAWIGVVSFSAFFSAASVFFLGGCAFIGVSQIAADWPGWVFGLAALGWLGLGVVLFRFAGVSRAAYAERRRRGETLYFLHWRMGPITAGVASIVLLSAVAYRLYQIAEMGVPMVCERF